MSIQSMFLISFIAMSLENILLFVIGKHCEDCILIALFFGVLWLLMYKKPMG